MKGDIFLLADNGGGVNLRDEQGLRGEQDQLFHNRQDAEEG